MKYRPDIDGLRAIAVLAVVGFHAFPTLVPGGFVGVDVFFVISGFLISGIIFSALERDRFTFDDFYARRIRRIFPALVVVLASMYAAGWFLLYADRFAELGQHIAGGAGFVANIVLWRQSGYFDGASDTKPLLHLWSLGVEEQFYLVWPLVAWLAWKRRIDLLAVTLAVLFASLYFNLDRIRRDLIGTFYAPHTRFWELMAGAVLAQLAAEPPRLRALRWLRDRYEAVLASSRTRTLMSIGGIVLIALSVAIIDQTRHFPGRWALMPVAGAAMLIASGPDALINRYLLAQPIAVGIGLLSYPLYLWHWPLLSFLRLVNGETAPVSMRAAAVGLSFVLAWLTYAVLERPIRFGPKRRWIVAALCFALTAVGAAGFYTYRADGLWARAINRSAQAPFSAYYDQMRKKGIVEPYRLECDFMELVTDRTKDHIAPACTTAGANGTWFLWGDSHAQALSPGLTSILPSGVALAQVATSSCPPRFVADSPQLPGQRCERANEFALQKIQELKPDVLILAEAGGHDAFDWNVFAERVRALGAKRVVLAGPLPVWQPTLPEIYVTRFWEAKPQRIGYGLAADRLQVDRQLIDRYTQSRSLTYVSMMRTLCDADGCLAIVPGSDPPELMAFDAAHLTPRGSVYVAQQILRPVLTGSGQVAPR